MKTDVNFLNSEGIVRLTPIKDNTLLVADNILDGKWKIFPTLPDLDIEKVDSVWEMKYPSTESTYSLYTYALYPVSYLLNAYEFSNNEVYLDKALLIAQSFIFWLNSSDKNLSIKRKNILWGDHAVSNRTQSLCYLLLLLNNSDKEIPSNLIDQLIIQGEYLSNIDNYSNYNHGLMMDLALLGLVNVLKGHRIDFPDYFRSRLVERLDNSLLRDVTLDGVHVENSPGYHFWIMSFYKKISQPLLELDKSLAEKCEKVLRKSSEYAKYITRSNGSIPAIGDTHASLKSMPSHTLSSKFFSKSNIVIFRDLDDKVWASFNSGYKTHVHKHADDGSFNLFYKGRDIFFDPGFLSYEENEESKIIKSSSFHNTVKPVDEEIQIIRQDLSGHLEKMRYENNISRSKVVGFYCTDKYEASLAIISGYKSGEIKRLIIYDRNGYFLIYDYKSKDIIANQVLEQRFNIGCDLDLVINGSSEALINDLNKNNLCEIRQFIRTDEKDSIIMPHKERSFYAKGFDEKEDFDRLVFSFKNSGSLILIKLIGYKNTISNKSVKVNDIYTNKQDIFRFIDSVINKFN